MVFLGWTFAVECCRPDKSNAPVVKARKTFAAVNGSPEVTAARPFLKWAGGKSQLLPAFATLYPARGTFKRYLDPFLGGGAVFFHVQALFEPKEVLLSDRNAALIETYQVVKDRAVELAETLAKLREKHSEAHYYKVREVDPEALDLVSRAARMIYLNKTCFNGLFRVNSQGHFNVPFGHRKNPGFPDRELLTEASRSLAKVKLRPAPFEEVLDHAEPGDFIYFDPPYHPISETANFTAYTKGSFGPADQERLADVFSKLDARGCLVMLSNSDTPFVRKLYREFREHTTTVLARRSINRDGDGRGKISELVVLNYAPPARAASSSAAKAAKLGNRAADAPA
jgi:DNA adenine methylase